VEWCRLKSRKGNSEPIESLPIELARIKRVKEIEGLRVQIDYAKWLYETDMRLSEQLQSRAAGFFAFVLTAGTFIVNFLIATPSTMDKPRLFLLITNSPNTKAAVNYLNVVLIALLVIAYFNCCVDLFCVFMARSAIAPFPMEPTQLFMLDNRYSESEILHVLAYDVIGAIRPPETEREILLSGEDLALHQKLARESPGESVWERNFRLRKKFVYSVWSLIIASGFFVVLILRLGWIS
jgi:hypothetical protein